MKLTKFTFARCFLGIALAVVGISGEFCTLCTHGSAPNLDGTLDDGTSCRDLNTVATQTLSNSDEDCIFLQALGHQACGCPSPPSLPEDACRVCPEGSSISTPDLEILGLNTTCGSIELVINLFLNSSEFCPFLPQFAYYCGCTNVEPSCTACSDGSLVSNPQAIIPHFNITCEFAQLLGSINSNQTECEEFQQGFTEATDGDICGCVDPATPSVSPSANPSTMPTFAPSSDPTVTPTFVSSWAPSVTPTFSPTTFPSTLLPTLYPTKTSFNPSSTMVPTNVPSDAPDLTTGPSPAPTSKSTVDPNISGPRVSPVSSSRRVSFPSHYVGALVVVLLSVPCFL